MNAEIKAEVQPVGKKESETPEGTERTKMRKVFIPLVDILESEGALLLTADMAGVDESGVDITVEKNVLTIRGTVVDEAPHGHSPAWAEYGIGDYERQFTLPNEIDRDQISATIKDGVLRLTLQKVKQAGAKRIPVNVG
jgi:HSP20 family protein